MKYKTVIGEDVLVAIDSKDKNIPAKIDTGADSSAIWASEIEVNSDDSLSFVLFDKSSKYYTGKKYNTKNYSVRSVKAANGISTIKFVVKLPVTICNKRFTAEFGLCDRSKHIYPILIGKSTLRRRFIVDVSIKRILEPEKFSYEKSEFLQKLLRENPQEFYNNYYLNNGEKA